MINIDDKKSVFEINRKIKSGKAVILTGREFTKELRSNKHRPTASDIDVVTIAFSVETSGTATMLCIPVTERGIFTRADKIWLNGLPCIPGPAPNERLGVVDVLVFAGQLSREKKTFYSGANLNLDIIRKKRIDVECLSIEGDIYRNTFSLDQLQFARMYIYDCFLETGIASGTVNTNISSRYLKTITTGSKVLVNKALGIIIGRGTHSTAEKTTLSLTADMFEMSPEAITEFETTDGIIIKNSVVLAIPILNNVVLEDLAGYLEEESRESVNNSYGDSENDLADHMKGLILKGSGLTESDMEI